MSFLAIKRWWIWEAAKVILKEEAIPVQRFTEVFLKKALLASVSFSVERLTAEWEVMDSIPGAGPIPILGS